MPQAQPSQSNRKRVLVIEDDATTIALIKQMLTEEGYDVTAVRNGKVGLKVAFSLLPDLILLDLMLPGVDGWQLYKTFQAKSAPTENVPIIVVSVIKSDEAKIESASGRKVHFIQKPFEFDTFTKYIKNVLTNSSL